MKKLMIAAAIVCAAAFAQAASVSWMASKIYDGKGGTDAAPDGWACYLFVDQTYAADTLAGELANGNTANLSKSESNTTAGDVMGGDYSYTSALANGTYDAYMVVFNNADATQADKFFVTTVGDNDLVISGSADGVDFGKITDMKSPDNWTNVVPEPTSGLLLLIGVAGLALRRRRD